MVTAQFDHPGTLALYEHEDGQPHYTVRLAWADFADEHRYAVVWPYFFGNVLEIMDGGESVLLGLELPDEDVGGASR